MATTSADIKRVNDTTANLVAGLIAKQWGWSTDENRIIANTDNGFQKITADDADVVWTGSKTISGIDNGSTAAEANFYLRHTNIIFEGQNGSEQGERSISAHQNGEIFMYAGYLNLTTDSGALILQALPTGGGENKVKLGAADGIFVSATEGNVETIADTGNITMQATDGDVRVSAANANFYVSAAGVVMDIDEGGIIINDLNAASGIYDTSAGQQITVTHGLITDVTTTGGINTYTSGTFDAHAYGFTGEPLIKTMKWERMGSIVFLSTTEPITGTSNDIFFNISCSALAGTPADFPVTYDVWDSMAGLQVGGGLGIQASACDIQLRASDNKIVFYRSGSQSNFINSGTKGFYAGTFTFSVDS